MSKLNYKALKEIQECHERIDRNIMELENELTEMIKPIDREEVKNIFNNQNKDE